MKYPLQTAEVFHLRSALQMLGYHVWASDGDFGVLEGFVMDDASWHLGYLDVKSGDWLKNRSVLVPTRWVDSVSWSEFRIDVLPVIHRADPHKLEGVVTLPDVLDAHGIDRIGSQ
jgi:hypothetical protein